MLFLEAGKLGLDPPGQEIHEQGPHLVIENDGAVVFVQDLETEAHRAFHLSPDGHKAGEVELEETVIDRGIGGGNVEVIQVGPTVQELGEFYIKFAGVEAQAVFFRQQHHAREMLGGLDVHVLVVAHMGELGPEGNVHRQGQLQGRIHLIMGEDAHGGGMEVAGDEGCHVFRKLQR